MGKSIYAIFSSDIGTFTVKSGDERAFVIYAKYYADCWSMYITDNLTDTLVDNGVYLVGLGWTGGSWDLVADKYIDSVSGITVTLSDTADFKITDYDPNAISENGRGWHYNDQSYYKVAGDAVGYLNFSGLPNSNIKVLAAGEYTITIVKGDEGAIEYFLFTPAEDVEPVTGLQFVDGGAYLVGENFDNAQWSLKKENYIDPEKGLTVTFTKNSAFKIIYSNADNPDWNTIPVYVMAAGKEDGYLNLPTSTENCTVITAGTYTITIDNSGESPKFVFTPAADLAPDTTAAN